MPPKHGCITECTPTYHSGCASSSANWLLLDYFKHGFVFFNSSFSLAANCFFLFLNDKQKHKWQTNKLFDNTFVVTYFHFRATLFPCNLVPTALLLSSIAARSIINFFFHQHLNYNLQQQLGQRYACIYYILILISKSHRGVWPT